ncbi:MAG: FtsX-like permease family protein [Candidatus Nitrosopolaris sp.]|jgi:putative ABC transport system permease protein
MMSPLLYKKWTDYMVVTALELFPLQQSFKHRSIHRLEAHHLHWRLLVSAIGVVTTLYTAVNERRKEIGTMKAIGAKPFFILSMFLSDAVLIGFIGASLGIVSGIGLAYLLSASGASGGGAYIAPIFLPNELVQVWLLSLTVTLLAGLFPAWKASRLSPLIAMRV